jgi:UDP-N-acetylmuramate--alanine ligase
MKIKVGIIFGGRSKEREISFAGGRTVYDNLSKSLFEAVPILVDSFNNLILLDWEYIYKGSIRDFYPAPDAIPKSRGDFQVYAESLAESDPNLQDQFIMRIGKKISIEELKQIVDFAFLCLHGPYGEDGRIQGLLEYFGIPYSGSGILPSAIGINKVVQKKLMSRAGFKTPAFTCISRSKWIDSRSVVTADLLDDINNIIGFPCVVKAPTQGSSIGVGVVSRPDQLPAAIDRSFFVRRIQTSEWLGMSAESQIETIRLMVDIREGIGIPVLLNGIKYNHPDALMEAIHLASQESPDISLLIESLDGESEVIIEAFIEGKEFSSIVIDRPGDSPVCLPPTEIRKGREVFDYRSKYLPGLSRKITPIQLPDDQIEKIRNACQALYESLGFGVYARIDGFITVTGEIYLNDPNTTSGMMPSSFFFHQAAEIGLNPSQFISFIIYASLLRRKEEFRFNGICEPLLSRLDQMLLQQQSALSNRKRIAVIFGGYSSERHISVESGRNVYEKLSSSTVYDPVPVFLSGNDAQHEMYTIPLNLMLKDNADDILEKIRHFSVHPVITGIISQCADITKKFGDEGNLRSPQQISYNDLPGMVSEVFIALHGRPGEDGALQRKLDQVGIPYNGSDADSSSVTIDKFRTNEILKAHGMLVAEHLIVSEDDWTHRKNDAIRQINLIGYPLIAKPVDDGCSSAVKKIRSIEELEAFARLIFRKSEELDPVAAEVLHIKPKEEFPVKRQFLVESLIEADGAETFLEITGGMLTHRGSGGEIIYELFEASEALSEGEVLSLEEKFLAGQGQNITPARYAKEPGKRQKISEIVKRELEKAARVLNIRGYARIDAFVRVRQNGQVEVIFIEVNSLPGMTPATCIFHQCALSGYKPYDFIEKIMTFAGAPSRAKHQTA